MEFPPIAPVSQIITQPPIADVAGEVLRQWQSSDIARRIAPGARVAVGVGSRGIANVAVMVKTTLHYLRDLGARPFVVAAMGSHGGGTPAGQRQLLAEYGISEEALGVPVKTDMATVQIGVNSWGEP